MRDKHRIITELRDLAKNCDPVILELPRNPVGLPAGSFILDHFLEYIADCLAGKVNPTLNDSQVESPEPDHDGD